MSTRSVLVVQPDHILLFELMAVDRRQLSPKAEAAQEMLLAQWWLDSHTRDILDESDGILHVRCQLVYTVSLQKPLKGHPDRWTTTQQVLNLVAKYATRVMSEGGTFPFIRVLHPTACEEQVQGIPQDVTSGALENLNFDQASRKVEWAVRSFIATEKVSNDCIRLIEDRYRKTPAWPGHLVLHGLLACGISVYALKSPKRTFRSVLKTCPRCGQGSAIQISLSRLPACHTITQALPASSCCYASSFY